MRCFQGYPLDRLPERLLAAIGPTPDQRTARCLLRLQCYLEVTEENLEATNARCPEPLLNFVAANFSKRFVSMRNPWTDLRKLKTSLGGSFPADELRVPGSWNRDGWSEGFRARVEHFAQRALNPDRVAFWKGWIAFNAAGKRTDLTLWKFHRAFGQKRTDQLFSAADDWFRSARDTRPPFIADFSSWLADHQATIDFDSSTELGAAFAEYYPSALRRGHASGVSLAVLLALWSRFVQILYDHLLGRDWAVPLPAVPRPENKRPPGAKTSIRTTPRGVEIKHSLVTPVPLEVSDSEAKELIFRNIRRDVDILLLWAREEVKLARERAERRKVLAKTGIASTPSTRGVNSGLRYRLSRTCPDWLSHASATFEANNFSHLYNGRAASLIYPTPVADTCWDLGLPTPALLLAHAAVLVAAHPKITPAFLDQLELFDRDGKQIGLIQTDAGWYLCGAKRRKGARFAEQRVLLTSETLQVVRDVIALTEPLRQRLRDEQHPNWRLLFIATPTLGLRPRAWNSTSQASRKTDWLAERFRLLANIDDTEATDLAERFSLRRLRASAAILIYFETGSVQRMAEALGHEVFVPKLLDHYLPKPLQEFFTERWIQIFQTGILCEALKTSQYLLDATTFQTMEQLDTFLENHALRRIPAHLENPDSVGDAVSDQATSKVVFGIEIGVLTLLLSLEAAVRRSTGHPCGRAIRWARICERLVPHLETQAEEPEFRRMIADAKRLANPEKVEHLIHE